MIVATMEIVLHLHASSSRKEKRAVVTSVRERLRHRFHCAVAEVGALDSWREARIGIALVGSDAKVLDRQISAITGFLDGDVRFEMVDRDVVIEKRSED